jgi:hypothetical protein
MTFHAPQLIFIALALISLGIVMSKHGEPKTGSHNVFIEILATAISFSLMYWGGFFG